MYNIAIIAVLILMSPFCASANPVSEGSIVRPDDYAMYDVFVGQIEMYEENGKTIYNLLTSDNGAPGRLLIGPVEGIDSHDCQQALIYAQQHDLTLFIDSEFIADESDNYIAKLDSMSCHARDRNGRPIAIPSALHVSSGGKRSEHPVIFTGKVVSAMVNGRRIYTLLTSDNGAQGRLILGNLDDPMPEMVKFRIAEAEKNEILLTLRTNYIVAPDGVYFIANPREVEHAKPDIPAPEGLLEQQIAADKQGNLIEIDDYIELVKNYFSGKDESKHFLKITALMDSVTVIGVTVNRGNRIYTPVNGMLPITINYGESILLFDDVLALAGRNYDKQDLSGKNKMEQNYAAIMALANTEQFVKIQELKIKLNTGLEIIFSSRK